MLTEGESNVATARRPPDFWVLARCRSVQLRNAFDEQLRHAPWRTLIVVVLLFLIWAALYLMLSTVLRHVHRWGLVGVVANQHIFIQFFLVLAVMLTFSNAILGFSNLYGRGDAAHLLATPMRGRHVVCAKWLEGMFLSSWSFMLLGVPLMLAVASTTDVKWYYYPLFIGHFVGFVALPATVGLIIAWVVAMWAPRRPGAAAIWAGCLVLLLAILWFTNISRTAMESGEWLTILLGQIGIAKQPFLPSTWTAKGIDAAMQQHVGESLFYLGVVLGNAAFLAWITVNVLGLTWGKAYSRAQQGRLLPTIRHGWFTWGLCWLLFPYLTRRLRMLMLKDVRGFARDARQWTQMVIMFGLLVIYVLNLRPLVNIENAKTQGLVAFLNLTTVSLILATFTSRFVYPLPSLESQQLWLLGLLPTRRSTMLWIKFLFALTVTGLTAIIVMGLAVYVLQLPAQWAILHIVTVVGVCIGLCGLSVGVGARFPMLGQRNPARIASGFGGTLNLILSMLFVFSVMAGVAFLSVNELQSVMRAPTSLAPESWAMCVGMFVVSVIVAIASLSVGGRHFERLEY